MKIMLTYYRELYVAACKRTFGDYFDQGDLLQ